MSDARAGVAAVVRPGCPRVELPAGSYRTTCRPGVTGRGIVSSGLSRVRRRASGVGAASGEKSCLHDLPYATNIRYFGFVVVASVQPCLRASRKGYLNDRVPLLCYPVRITGQSRMAFGPLQAPANVVSFRHYDAAPVRRTPAMVGGCMARRLR